MPREEVEHQKNGTLIMGEVYKDPTVILQVCIYDMLRHVIWKLMENDHDISFIALVEKGRGYYTNQRRWTEVRLNYKELTAKGAN